MNGQDLRTERERLGFSLQEVALAAEVPLRMARRQPRPSRSG